MKHCKNGKDGKEILDPVSIFSVNAKEAVNKAKEYCIQKVASDAEAAVKDGKVRWNNIHRLQRVYCDRRPIRPTAVENGELIKGPSDCILSRF